MSDLHHPHPASTCDAFPLAVALSQAQRRIAELERLLGEAVLAEREACAKLAEQWLEPVMATPHENATYRSIAAAIRARAEHG